MPTSRLFIPPPGFRPVMLTEGDPTLYYVENATVSMDTQAKIFEYSVSSLSEYPVKGHELYLEKDLEDSYLIKKCAFRAVFQLPEKEVPLDYSWAEKAMLYFHERPFGKVIAYFYHFNPKTKPKHRIVFAGPQNRDLVNGLVAFGLEVHEVETGFITSTRDLDVIQDV